MWDFIAIIKMEAGLITFLELSEVSPFLLGETPGSWHANRRKYSLLPAEGTLTVPALFPGSVRYSPRELWFGKRLPRVSDYHCSPNRHLIDWHFLA